jgi:hypothetical protein
MGMNKPVHVVPRDVEVEEIVNVAAIAVVDAQENEELSWPERAKPWNSLESEYSNS